MSTTNGTSQDGTPAMDWQEQVFEINGEKVTLQELQAGYMRQSDYTRKTQELAKERETLQSKSDAGESLTDDERSTLEWLQNHKFLTEQQLEEKLNRIQEQARMEASFEGLVQANPSLKKHEKAIRAIKQTDDRSFEEIALDYWFISSEKLEKAKGGIDKMVGSIPDTETKVRSVADLTPEEYEKWKKDNGVTGSMASTLRGAI